MREVLFWDAVLIACAADLCIIIASPLLQGASAGMYGALFGISGVPLGIAYFSFCLRMFGWSVHNRQWSVTFAILLTAGVFVAPVYYIAKVRKEMGKGH